MYSEQDQKIIQIQDWYQGVTGRMVLELEQARLRRVLPGIYGEYALQIAGPSGCHMLADSPIKHKLTIDPSCADFTRLPFAPNSIDLVLMPHVLEFSHSPKQLLSQCYQMIAPHGHIVMFTFTPWSAWGAWRHMKRYQGVPWSGKFWPVSKISYWLDAIGYSVVKQDHLCFHWPTENAFWAKYDFVFEVVGQFCWSNLGAVSMIIAQKEMKTMTPIKASWWARRDASMGVGCAEASSVSHVERL
jgi:SAM-dependent methyltransferase